MTEKRANEIFRTKYPEGEIVRRNNSSAGNKFWVTFKPNGKVYYYACSTYQELLSRFGFKIAYKHDIETVKGMIDMYDQKILDVENGKVGLSLFKEDTLENQKKFYEEQKQEYQKRLDHMLNECIID